MAFRGMFQEEPNEITDVTRRAIFDEIIMKGMFWCGRLDEAAFLSRVFNLGALPSSDRRYRTMAEDVWQHRVRNNDGEDDWFVSDPRLNLLAVPDETFLNFLAATVHPMVQSDEAEVDRFVELFNRHLAADGYQVTPVQHISGRRVFAGARALPGAHEGLTAARAIADELSSEHMSAQITRMQSNIVSDPALAIGTSKEVVESLCKAILDRRSVSRTGNEDFPKLCKMARESIGLNINPTADLTLKTLSGSLATITGSIAELRAQMGTGHGGAPETQRPPVAVARLAVNVATALGVFLWETHCATAIARREPWFNAAEWDPM